MVRFNEKAFRHALIDVDKTQRQVAAECEINANSFTRIKRGADTPISLAIKIARAVNKNVEDLWSLDE